MNNYWVNLEFLATVIIVEDVSASQEERDMLVLTFSTWEATWFVTPPTDCCKATVASDNFF